MKCKILLLIVILIYPVSLSTAEPPAGEDVRRELEKLLGEKYRPIDRGAGDYSPGEGGAFIGDIIIEILRFLYNIRYILAALATAVIIYFLYSSFKNVFQYYRTGKLKYRTLKGGGEELYHETAAHPLSYYYNRAGELSGRGDYSTAVIWLQKGCAAYLKQKFITNKAIHYTNNELRRIAGEEKGLQEPFKLITNFAEAAAFSSSLISKEEYRQALDHFEKAFLES